MCFSLALDIIWVTHKLPGRAQFGEGGENLPSLSPHCVLGAFCASPQHPEHDVSQQVAQLLLGGLLKKDNGKARQRKKEKEQKEKALSI